jgi:hypothetical protein
MDISLLIQSMLQTEGNLRMFGIDYGYYRVFINNEPSLKFVDRLIKRCLNCVALCHVRENITLGRTNSSSLLFCYVDSS